MSLTTTYCTPTTFSSMQAHPKTRFTFFCGLHYVRDVAAVFICSSYRRHHTKFTAKCYIKGQNQKVNVKHTLISFCSSRCSWWSMQQMCRAMPYKLMSCTKEAQSDFCKQSTDRKPRGTTMHGKGNIREIKKRCLTHSFRIGSLEMRVAYFTTERAEFRICMQVKC